jgi:uncharacterized protein YlxW (UPF0749 family)
MRRSHPAATRVAVLLTLAAALLLAACGAAATEAEQKLDGALKEYESALDQVKQLDLRTAAADEVAAARERLNTAWQDVETRSSEAGSDIAATLRSGYETLDERLGKVAGGVETGLDEAEQAVEKAVDSVRGKLDEAWQALKDLF